MLRSGSHRMVPFRKDGNHSCDFNVFMCVMSKFGSNMDTKNKMFCVLSFRWLKAVSSIWVTGSAKETIQWYTIHDLIKVSCHQPNIFHHPPCFSVKLRQRHSVCILKRYASERYCKQINVMFTFSKDMVCTVSLTSVLNVFPSHKSFAKQILEILNPAWFTYLFTR